MFDILWRSVAIGIGATILMDLWAILLAKLGVTGSPNWAPAGRWFWHLGKGKVKDARYRLLPVYSELLKPDPAMKARFAELGGIPMPMPPAEMVKLIADEIEKWAKVIHKGNIKPT